jgi:hypothetical protein
MTGYRGTRNRETAGHDDGLILKFSRIYTELLREARSLRADETTKSPGKDSEQIPFQKPGSCGQTVPCPL